MNDPNASSIPLMESSAQHDRAVVQQQLVDTAPAATTISRNDHHSQVLPLASPLDTADAAPLLYKVPANVIAVFVARFDITSGNTIEWQYPEEIDLSGIEYKAICSGLHNIETDTIYFTKTPYLGVSLYKKEDAAASERGAIMRSVGIMLEQNDNFGSCSKVWAHGKALKSLNPFATPNELRKTMRKYYDEHRLHQKSCSQNTMMVTSLESSPLEADIDNDIHAFNPEALLYDTHLSYNIFDQLLSLAPYPLEPLPFLSSLPMFIAYLGPQVFVLWKAAILRKRILFLTEPPMERAAGHVYNTYLLGTVPDKYQSRYAFTPKYTISVNDIPDLIGCPDGFVASTSDSIYEIKTELYDVLVKLPKIVGNHHDYHQKQQQQQQQQWLSESTATVHSTCPEIDPRHNAADLIRFRSIVRQLFDTARDMGFAEDMNVELRDALERKGDVIDAISVAMFQLTLWWFRPSPSQLSKLSTTGQSNMSWQRIFAGSSQGGGSTRHHSRQSRKRQGSRTPLQDIPMDREEHEHLLLGENSALEEDEQDATELSNNEVFHVVTARASCSSAPHDPLTQPEAPTTAQEKLTGALVGFFHSLTRQMFSRLDSILSANESDQSGIVHIYPRDMIQLGLHPHLDADFVTELAYKHFDKHVRVISPINASCPCCCGPTEGTLRL